jgi:hypothetical protein
MKKEERGTIVPQVMSYKETRGTYLLVYFNSEAQFGQRVALIAIVLNQCGHSFVIGPAGAAGAGASFFMLFTAFMIRKTTKAITRKSIVVCIAVQKSFFQKVERFYGTLWKK